jgi:hypothetical protein
MAACMTAMPVHGLVDRYGIGDSTLCGTGERFELRTLDIDVWVLGARDLAIDIAALEDVVVEEMEPSARAEDHAGHKSRMRLRIG